MQYYVSFFLFSFSLEMSNTMYVVGLELGSRIQLLVNVQDVKLLTILMWCNMPYFLKQLKILIFFFNEEENYSCSHIGMQKYNLRFLGFLSCNLCRVLVICLSFKKKKKKFLQYEFFGFYIFLFCWQFSFVQTVQCLHVVNNCYNPTSLQHTSSPNHVE